MTLREGRRGERERGRKGEETSLFSLSPPLPFSPSRSTAASGHLFAKLLLAPFLQLSPFPPTFHHRLHLSLLEHIGEVHGHLELNLLLEYLAGQLVAAFLQANIFVRRNAAHALEDDQTLGRADDTADLAGLQGKGCPFQAVVPGRVMA